MEILFFAASRRASGVARTAEGFGLSSELAAEDCAALGG